MAWGALAADFCVAAGQVAAVYYAAAGFLHCALPRLASVQGLQSIERSPGQVWREASTSIGPILVKGAVIAAVQQLHRAGWSRLYDAPLLSSPAEALYGCCSVLALDVLHDAWFYWTHRLLHWRPLYRRIHRLHHLSRAPTAFAGYSFHWAEALLVFANEILVCFLLPLNYRLHRGYHLFTTVIHIGGHAGYEIAPFIPSLEGLLVLAWRGLGGPPGAGRRGAAALNTVRHHDMHHAHPAFHFSLYFTHWDRWCGTEHPAYRGPGQETGRAQAAKPERSRRRKGAEASGLGVGGCLTCPKL